MPRTDCSPSRCMLHPSVPPSAHEIEASSHCRITRNTQAISRHAVAGQENLFWPHVAQRRRCAQCLRRAENLSNAIPMQNRRLVSPNQFTRVASAKRSWRVQTPTPRLGITGEGEHLGMLQTLSEHKTPMSPALLTGEQHDDRDRQRDDAGWRAAMTIDPASAETIHSSPERNSKKARRKAPEESPAWRCSRNCKEYTIAATNKG